jgi:hypothetical protein
MPNMGPRALDQAGSNNVTKLTIKNCILKSTDTYTDNQNGIVQFAASSSAFSTNNVTLEQNYIETFTRTFLYTLSPSCNDWAIKNNDILSYYFSFGPYVGNNGGSPGGLVIQGNRFDGNIPGDPPSRASSPPGYDGRAFNGVLGNAVVTGNTFTKMILGLGDVWLYGATVQGNNFTDCYLSALALRSSDNASPPKPPSNNVVIENNVIEYNGTPFTNGDNPNFLSQGIWINRPSGGTTLVDASTIYINFNRFTDLGVSDSTQVWAIRQGGDGTADATNNYWGPSTDDIRVDGKLLVIFTQPGVTSFTGMCTHAHHPNTCCACPTRQEASRLLPISSPTKMTLRRPASLASGPSTLSTLLIAPLAPRPRKGSRTRPPKAPPRRHLWNQRRLGRTWSSLSKNWARAKAVSLNSQRWLGQASR